MSAMGASMSNLAKYNFHGDQLDVIDQDGQLFVGLKPMCSALDVSTDAQRVKLRGKPWSCTAMIAVHDASGRKQEMFCLHIDSVPMWLATIEPSKVAPHVRAKLLRYQLECARVLRDHFIPSRASAPPAPTFVPATAPVQSRIGDDPRAILAIRAWCSTAARVAGRTVQSVHGELRKPWGVASIYRIPLVALDHTLAELQRITVTQTNVRRLPADRRQLRMFEGGVA
jgi:hypothetical protein